MARSYIRAARSRFSSSNGAVCNCKPIGSPPLVKRHGTLTRPGDADPDVGRGNAFDIDPNYPGYETWDSYNADIYNISSGTVIQSKPTHCHAWAFTLITRQSLPSPVTNLE